MLNPYPLTPEELALAKDKLTDLRFGDCRMRHEIAFAILEAEPERYAHECIGFDAHGRINIVSREGERQKADPLRWLDTFTR